MSKKTLLLNSSYEVLSFITERRMLKLLIKDKAEIISHWDDYISWKTGKIKHPAILRLKHHVKRNFVNTNFSRFAIVKRDKSQCQYCDKKLMPSQITIDHVIPKSKKGATSFMNCVVSCHACNNKKGDKTLEQSGMVLLRKPTHPSFTAKYFIHDNHEQWHSDWNDYLGE